MPVPFDHQPKLGEIMALRRIELGLSEDELATLLGRAWRSQDVHRLESSPMVMPSWIRLKELAEVLQLPLDDLLGLAMPADESVS